ncbi:MAG: dihydrofolate reductase [Gammaproteobacteria bacterium]|nr:dihydrofolate reductase [Gammaproteobacteria bacterium]
MRVSLIWAMTKNRVIGRDNDLPWHLPDEMRHFVRTTQGKPVVMGRKQFESMGKPLPKRMNIVLSRNSGFAPTGTTVVGDLDAALRVAESSGAEEVMVIGGAEIYRLALPYADRLYFTLIDTELAGDTFFPQFDESRFREVSAQTHPADDRHAFAYTVRVLDRR